MDRKLVPYMGSKWILAPLIIRQLGRHKTYVEVFGGSGVVLLRKPPSRVEVFNDLNRQLTTFFRVVRDRCEELSQAIRFTPYARVEFEGAVRSLEAGGLCDLETARCVSIVLMQSIRNSLNVRVGDWCSGSKTRGPYDIGGWKDHPEAIREASQRLRSVFIECKDWSYVLNRYDSPRTAFYVDPPYLHQTRDGGRRYNNEMTDLEHVHLLKACRKLQGHVVISGYRSVLYDEALKDWRLLEQHVKTHGTTRTEAVWVKPGRSCQPPPWADGGSLEPVLEEGVDDLTGVLSFFSNGHQG